MSTGAAQRVTRPVSVSVVVPVYGNAATLPRLASRIGAALARRRSTYELIFVDDASPDDSLDVARTLAASDAAIGGLALRRNVGQNAAILAGFGFASGDRVVTLDADLQDPPEAIPALLDEARHGWAAVFAGRRGRYQRLGRRLTSRLYKRVMHHLCGLPPDAGLFFAADRRLVRMLLERRETTWILPMIGLSDLPATSIPVERSRRAEGTSAYSGSARLRVALGPIAYGLRRRLGYSPRAPGDAPRQVEVGERFGCCADEVDSAARDLEGVP